MYDWEVRLGRRNLLSACGVTDVPMRARRRMLDAVGTAPDGEVVRGAVTVIELALPHDSYDVFQTIVLVERDTNGIVRWLVPYPAANVLTYTDPVSGRLRTAIDLREPEQ